MVIEHRHIWYGREGRTIRRDVVGGSDRHRWRALCSLARTPPTPTPLFSFPHSKSKPHSQSLDYGCRAGEVGRAVRAAVQQYVTRCRAERCASIILQPWALRDGSPLEKKSYTCAHIEHTSADNSTHTSPLEIHHTHTTKNALPDASQSERSLLRVCGDGSQRNGTASTPRQHHVRA